MKQQLVMLDILILSKVNKLYYSDNLERFFIYLYIFKPGEPDVLQHQLSTKKETEKKRKQQRSDE